MKWVYRKGGIMETKNITRLEVINHSSEGETGRLLVKKNISASLSLQDEGRTLKVFLDDAVELIPDTRENLARLTLNLKTNRKKE